MVYHLYSFKYIAYLISLAFYKTLTYKLFLEDIVTLRIFMNLQ